MKTIKWADFSRRQIMKAGAAAAAAGVLPGALASSAFAGAEEDAIIASAKKLTATEVTGILWSNYQVAVSPIAAEFKAATGIDLSKIQDISTFDIPQRAMAEALSKSPEFDFFHVDSNMIPSLASAGLLEPLELVTDIGSFAHELLELGDGGANFLGVRLVDGLLHDGGGSQDLAV